MGIASLILGLVSLVGFWLVFGPILAIPAGIVGIVLGVIALVKKQQKGMAIAGIILSAAGVLVAVAFVVYWLSGGIRI